MGCTNGGNSTLPPQEAKHFIPFQGLFQSRPLWGRIFTLAPHVENSSLLLRFGQLTPTNRAHFIVWPDQWCELELGGFNRVDFYSFDIVSVHGVASFLLGKAQ
jgi:hypothetical protein